MPRRRKCRFENGYVPFLLGQPIEPTAMAVAGAWLTLLLAGMWRRAHTWINKLGIAVEASWIALDVFA